MPNTNSEINRELVKAFNAVLLFGETAFTNLTVENVKRSVLSKQDHIVLSFEKNMNTHQCKEYLSNMRKSIVEKFCGDESAANDLFYTKFFPFKFDRGKWTKDNKFLVPMEKEVVRNLKYLLANELIRFTIGSIIEDHPDEDYVEDNIYDKGFDRKSYLYCKGFDDGELQNSFVSLFSSNMENYENSPKKFKDFLEEEGNHVYLKKGIFDNLKFIQDIVKRRVSSICRSLDTPNGEVKTVDMLKFTVVDLLRKAGISVDRILRDSYSDSDEDSILIPIVSYNNNDGRYLTREEVDRVNNMFGMVVLNNVEGHTSQKSLLGSKGVYGIDFANPDIAYCVMDKIIESSVINKDHKLSIDPARVLAMQLPPQTLAPPEVEKDGASGDSGIETTPPKPKDSAACSSSDSSPEEGSTLFIKRFSMKRQSPKRKQPESNVSDEVKKTNKDSGVHLESFYELPDSKLESSTIESRAHVPVSERDFLE
ncbi:hypothetical protein Wcon_00539 [Wolbachia endosymbiont of Cylisticus convexus]|uniref:hypothetical protein n=1 Tax=Wolbachia endosymbiont of Cylisticus convexus TaxID=118728 RepID=UPI000E14FAE6|nr:hypothetical protein [Wolbachia endosymbiont of Cylisticus convexus]RDD35283.1 hypothetical protein Wcon_00539 [Wolbachia endosymbiont of Cylisticus convexus]